VLVVVGTDATRVQDRFGVGAEDRPPLDNDLVSVLPQWVYRTNCSNYNRRSMKTPGLLSRLVCLLVLTVASAFSQQITVQMGSASFLIAGSLAPTNPVR
jgi:hypothetical protein